MSDQKKPGSDDTSSSKTSEQGTVVVLRGFELDPDAARRAREFTLKFLKERGSQPKKDE